MIGEGTAVKLIDDLFEQTQNMPMLPKVVQEVMQLLNADNGDVKTLVDKINYDQVLSAKVLRISNSAYFGRSGKVSTIEEAISLIGLGKLNTLVLDDAEALAERIETYRVFVDKAKAYL